MTALLDVKKRLSAVWHKESDKNETYEFDLSAETAWGCIRSNHSGSSRFKLAYDIKTERLWWGQSYFLDPDDLKGKPDKIVWFRASDPSKKKGAFLWKKVRDVPLRFQQAPNPNQKSSAAAKVQAKQQPKASPSVKVVAKSQPPKMGTSSVPAVSNTTSQSENRSSPARGRWPNPEVILNFEQLAVIYKPPHWKCELPEKDSDEHKRRTDWILLRWIREKITDIDTKLYDEDFNPAISGTGFGPLAHRIDMETSGLLIVVKTAAAQRHIKAQFHQTQVSKRYVCLVHGQVKAREGLIDASIRTVRTDCKTRSEISSSGEWAETRYQVIATYSGANRSNENASVAPGYSLVACDIKSGRTHQIRVHMLHLGHPLVSDDKYLSAHGFSEDRVWCPRLFLHSYRMRFRKTDDKEVCVTCPLPDDLREVVMKLGRVEGEVDDSLFGETSWQRNILRPAIDAWRPGTQVLRKVMKILRDEGKPKTLNALNADPELKALLSEEGLTGIGRAWLAKYWDVIDILPSDENNEICMKLRCVGDDGQLNKELDWDRQIESVQFQIEGLQGQKQRAIAEEDYEQAAEIKRRIEAVSQQLHSLETMKSDYFKRLQMVGPENEGDEPAENDESLSASVQVASSRPAKPKVEAFAQDVRDESLFPSLGGSKASRSMPMFSNSRSRDVSTDSRYAKNAASRDVSTDSRYGKSAAVRDVSTDSRYAKSETSVASGDLSAHHINSFPETAPDSVEEVVPPLKDALIEFLVKREGFVAHINEINNDKTLRMVMKMQLPKPVAAVNKAWLKVHEELFALLRTADGEMYVGLEAKARPKGAKTTAKLPGSGNEKKETAPAYHQVVQKLPDTAAPALVYDYSVKKGSESKTGENKQDGTTDWKDKFLGVIRRAALRSCSIDQLLEGVPQFAKSVGARKVSEQRELLTIFVQSCTDTFKVEKQGFGPDRKYMVSEKH